MYTDFRHVNIYIYIYIYTDFKHVNTSSLEDQTGRVGSFNTVLFNIIAENIVILVCNFVQ